jgi:UDP-N-acetylmuramate--alanine ligase
VAPAPAARKSEADPVAPGAAADWAGRKLHFIAIGGAGMSGLALVCHRLGAEVTGTDRAESSYMERLRGAGLAPVVGHDAEAIPPDAEVVVSSAIPDDNPELERARERGQRVVHRGELLAELAGSKRTIAVAGTHGKTTTAAMIAHALTRTGADPAFLLGGELPEAGPDGDAANAGWGEGDWIVVEADESDASFLRLQPEVAVITNVELDHHARWSSRAELEDAFRGFLEPVERVAVGPQQGLDLLVAEGARMLRFDTDSPGPLRLELAVPGEHNLLNARAALAALELAEFELDPAALALRDFPGVRRRLEFKGERGGVRIYDDYAHHPTEVEAALRAARELSGEGRLVAVFQPHLYSRTKALASEFGASLALADEVGVLEVYPAREEPVGDLEGVSGLAVAEAAADRAQGRPVWWLVERDRARRVMADRLRPGDVLVTLGAGDIFLLAEELAA